ncbi:hypothetical protein NG764_09985 [Aliarcobacter cryaerophilus]|uniref:hypothetical protein n=1 Tax=Aliarcobacter cryaerophilus TaxID=28198 RepID=UPI003DA3A9AE
MKQNLKLIYTYFIKKSKVKILLSMFLICIFYYYFTNIMNIGKKDLFENATLSNDYWFQMLINFTSLLISSILVYDKKAESLVDRHTQINKVLLVFIVGFIIVINQRDNYLLNQKYEKIFIEKTKIENTKT